MGSAGRTLTLPGPDGPSSAPVQPGSPFFFLESVMFCTVLGSCCRNNLWFIKILNWALLSRLLPGSIHKIYHSHACVGSMWLKGFQCLWPLAHFGGEQVLCRAGRQPKCNAGEGTVGIDLFFIVFFLLPLYLLKLAWHLSVIPLC